MSNIAVRVENLSKKYSRGLPSGHDRLSEVMANIGRLIVQTPARWLGRRRHLQSLQGPGEFWALRDASFEIPRGEVVGIIGRNGAGKSTLLKILSRITEPTAGRFGLSGRVASLLEVGTGFHPELTGRENIFLAATLLGMDRREIRRRLDEIVAYSEVGAFLDTPVKRYSSGMLVRLGFAVAAHIDSEILILDEVLAVGDVAFTRKSMATTKEAARTGRTVLLVTHNLQAIMDFCTSAIILNGGRIDFQGHAAKAVELYLNRQSPSEQATVAVTPEVMPRTGKNPSVFHWTKVTLCRSDGAPTTVLRLGEPFRLRLEGESTTSIDGGARLGFSIDSMMGFTIFNSLQVDGGLGDALQAGPIVLEATVDQNFLAPGGYRVSLAAMGPRVYDLVESTVIFHVEDAGDRSEQRWRAHSTGIAFCPVRWSDAAESPP